MWVCKKCRSTDLGVEFTPIDAKIECDLNENGDFDKDSGRYCGCSDWESPIYYCKNCLCNQADRLEEMAEWVEEGK